MRVELGEWRVKMKGALRAIIIPSALADTIVPLSTLHAQLYLQYASFCGMMFFVCDSIRNRRFFYESEQIQNPPVEHHAHQPRHLWLEAAGVLHGSVLYRISHLRGLRHGGPDHAEREPAAERDLDGHHGRRVPLCDQPREAPQAHLLHRALYDHARRAAALRHSAAARPRSAAAPLSLADRAVHHGLLLPHALRAVHPRRGQDGALRRAGHDQHPARHPAEHPLPRGAAHGHHGLRALDRPRRRVLRADALHPRKALAAAHAQPRLGLLEGDAALQHPHDPGDGVLVDHERVRPLYGHGLHLRERQRHLRRELQAAHDPHARVRHLHGGVAVFRRVRVRGRQARAHAVFLARLVRVPGRHVPRGWRHHGAGQAGCPRARGPELL